MPKTIDAHVRIPEDLHEQLRIEAARQGRTISNLLIYLARQGLAQPKLPPPPAAAASEEPS